MVVCGRRLPSYLLLVVLVLVVPSRGNNLGVAESCCYGSAVVQHGQVALNLAACCLKHVCRNGRIEAQNVGSPGDTHCCEFDGLLYPEGAHLAAQCLPLQCKGGHWTLLDHIEDCCKHCSLYNDPHICTFDDYCYDWHATCNYTVTQTGFTTQPEVGVFSVFVPCNGEASCLAATTFRDNPHTIVTLDHRDVFDIVVNGEELTVPAGGVHVVRSSSGRHPLLAWREDACLFLLGSSKLVVRHCQQRLDVWAYPSHSGHLHGLCGHLNSYRDDDFTDRQGGLHPPHPRPRAFPESWRTSEQRDQRCRGPCLDCYQETTEDPCRAKPEQREVYSHRCRKLLHPIIGRDAQLLHHVDNCAFDVCMMHQNGASDREVDRWLVEVQILVQQSKIILARTLDGQRPNTDPLPDDTRCTQSSHWKVACNKCWCAENGIVCTLKFCFPEYVHKFGEDACDNDSRWKSDKCNTCVCVRGGEVCSLDPCDGGGSIPEVCLLDTVVGPCEAHIQRYTYNRVTNKCEVFFYGGCEGNGNNFETQQECWEVCGGNIVPVSGVSKPDQCLQVKDSGPCYGSFPRYAYNRETNQCELFTYGGCQGNANNFNSLQKCEYLCKDLDGIDATKPEKCFQERETGPCRKHVPRFAYNQATDQCDSFVYGGCLGNENNFLTLRDCQEVCGGHSDIVCDEPSCPSRCQITIDVASGCPTCSCQNCPQVTCHISCQVVVDPQTGCQTCKCPCPKDQFGGPPCPLDCAVHFVVDEETGCERCECDPDKPSLYHP